MRILLLATWHTERHEYPSDIFDEKKLFDFVVKFAWPVLQQFEVAM
jgi:hypothetical protein